jgi:hypothetical protein
MRGDFSEHRDRRLSLPTNRRTCTCHPGGSKTPVLELYCCVSNERICCHPLQLFLGGWRGGEDDVQGGITVKVNKLDLGHPSWKHFIMWNQKARIECQLVGQEASRGCVKTGTKQEITTQKVKHLFLLLVLSKPNLEAELSQDSTKGKSQCAFYTFLLCWKNMEEGMSTIMLISHCRNKK